ncbi:MAG: 6-carboxytetrahydropterin synthase QueD [Spirochaetes bacterium]|nr:6-carboxytetrahydropterin synthase QueD [Spirochaetota bacterium]
MLTIYTESFFDSAHLIKNHPGKCAFLHGHTWKVSVWVRGDSSQTDSRGILWDFGNLKEITDKLDHKNLNDIIDMPTAENIAQLIYSECKAGKAVLEFKIRVYENVVSKTSYCETGDF